MENVAKNNDTLGDLYALRAGLSLISQNVDEIEKRLNTIGLEEWREGGKTVFDMMARGDEKFKNLEIIENNYGWEKDRVYKRIDLTMKEVSELDKRDRKYERYIFCEWLNTSEAEEVLSRKYREEKNKYEHYSELIDKTKRRIRYLQKDANKYGILSLLTLPTILGFILCQAKVVKLSEKIDGLNNNEIQNAEKQLKKGEGLIKYFERYRKICQQNNKANMPSMRVIKQNSEAIYSALQKSFNKVLDERDWQYLDLIIYYLETGRADSKKEALQLLEREIQTKRIIGAIEEAKECICSTIERVATRISAQLGVISSQLTQIANLQQIQIAQNSELISQTSMQNALIAKSNVTSEQLMNDVKYIKNYGI